jgi:hypothetical protein
MREHIILLLFLVGHSICRTVQLSQVTGYFIDLAATEMFLFEIMISPVLEPTYCSIQWVPQVQG